MMEIDRFRAIIDEVAPFAFDVNLHHRGESLLHPRIVEMMEYASGRGLYTNLHTNGTVMTEKLARGIVASGLDILSFSVDAVEPEAYERIRVGAKLDKVLANLRLLLDMRSEAGSRTPHVTLEAIDFDPATSPARRQEARRRLFTLLGAPAPDAVRVKAPHNWAGDWSSGDGCPGSPGMSPCLFLWYSLTILHDGTVVACPQDMSGGLEVGERAPGGILEAWNGPHLRRLRERMVARDVKGLSPCDRCDRIRRRLVLGLPGVEVSRFLRENLLR
jgi:hypothetical protein